MKKTIGKFEDSALTEKQSKQIKGGGWIFFTTPEGRGGLNDKNNNGRWDPGESHYFIYNTKEK